jgi:hypothetical protein
MYLSSVYLVSATLLATLLYIAKAHAFVNHLASAFQPNPTNLPDEEEPLVRLLEFPYQLEPPLHRFKQTLSQTVINNLSLKTSPGYDLITGKILRELPLVGINTSPNF